MKTLLHVWQLILLQLLLRRGIIMTEQLAQKQHPLQGTFHRRKLPPPAIPFSSTEGKHIFQEALLSGGMRVYFNLAETFQTQGDPSFCGLGSLTTALNAILLDPQRVWRGVWRWWDESMLDCCSPADIVKLRGLSLSQVHCLARCQGAATTLHFAHHRTEEEFRTAVKRSCHHEEDTDQPIVIIICSYSRAVLNQSGSGHFSPIGGYHADQDLVLIMDVARFKYPPHWVPLPLLFAAMNTLDSENGLSRGWMTVQFSEEINNRITQCCHPKQIIEADASSSELPMEEIQNHDDNGNADIPQEQPIIISRRIHELVEHKCSMCCSTFP